MDQKSSCLVFSQSNRTEIKIIRWLTLIMLFGCQKSTCDIALRGEIPLVIAHEILTQCYAEVGNWCPRSMWRHDDDGIITYSWICNSR